MPIVGGRVSGPRERLLGPRAALFALIAASSVLGACESPPATGAEAPFDPDSGTVVDVDVTEATPETISADTSPNPLVAPLACQTPTVVDLGWSGQSAWRRDGAVAVTESGLVIGAAPAAAGGLTTDVPARADLALELDVGDLGGGQLQFGPVDGVRLTWTADGPSGMALYRSDDAATPLATGLAFPLRVNLAQDGGRTLWTVDGLEPVWVEGPSATASETVSWTLSATGGATVTVKALVITTCSALRCTPETCVQPCVETGCSPFVGCFVDGGAPCDDGVACTDDRCADGSCEHVPDDGPCDDGDLCTGVERCDPAAGCLAGVVLVCDDGDPCTGLETCDPATGCTAGSASVCNDDDVCNGVESCGPDGTCVLGIPLECDDGNVCNGQEACDPATGCTAGVPLSCNDLDPCNGAESCDPIAGCVGGNPIACDDGNACNGLEQCETGVGCNPGTPLVCNDGNVCNGLESCSPALGCLPGDALDCDDGLPCNGLEGCDGATGCMTGEPLPGCCTAHSQCEDGNPCNGLGTCDGATGTCEVLPAAKCDDGNACNGVEVCSQTAGCVSGAPLVCDDDDVCNGLESCVPALGCRPGTPLTCDDGLPCTGQESCDPASGCVTTDPPAGCCETNVDCDDQDACNGAEWCDGTVGACRDGAALACDDGDVCNGFEACVPSSGCRPGSPLTCEDGNPCNGIATCDPLFGCLSGPSLSCSDGNVCNGLERCGPNGCEPGTPLACDDGLPCNGLEACNSTLGCYTSVIPEGCCSSPQDCEDGNACNGIGDCDGGVCVVSPAPACDDGNPCNGDEVCDAISGCVTLAPTPCSDGNPCNGQESCAQGLGCQPGKSFSCDDGDACTQDACDPKAGCSHVAIGECVLRVLVTLLGGSGALTDSPTALAVPAGAVVKPVQVTAAPAPNGDGAVLSSGGTVTSAHFLEPPALTFAVPATLTLPLPDDVVLPPGSQIPVLTQEPSTGAWVTALDDDGEPVLATIFDEPPRAVLPVESLGMIALEVPCDGCTGACSGPADCADGELCRFPDGLCGGTGQCVPAPALASCSGLASAPVCGCDGQDHDTPCLASAVGISVAHGGFCRPCTTQQDCASLGGAFRCVADVASCGQTPSIGQCRTASTCSEGPDLLTCACGVGSFDSACAAILGLPASGPVVGLAADGCACASVADCASDGETTGRYCHREIGRCLDVGICRPTSAFPSWWADEGYGACGCDGQTYPTNAAAALADVGAHWEYACGCDADSDCGSSGYCRRPDGRCAGKGVCAPRDDIHHYCSERPVCGCDGRTYATTCHASNAGISIGALEACPGCAVDGDCASGERCVAPDGNCGGARVCRPAPDSCTDNDPVCGCDGAPWPSPCAARAAGVAVASLGECPCKADEDCDLGPPDCSGNVSVEVTRCVAGDCKRVVQACEVGAFCEEGDCRTDVCVGVGCPCSPVAPCVGADLCSGTTFSSIACVDGSCEYVPIGECPNGCALGGCASSNSKCLGVPNSAYCLDDARRVELICPPGGETVPTFISECEGAGDLVCSSDGRFIDRIACSNGTCGGKERIAQCPTGTTCSGGTCVPGCTTDANCSGASYCSANRTQILKDKCVGGVCTPVQQGTCQASSPCIDGQCAKGCSPGVAYDYCGRDVHCTADVKAAYAADCNASGKCEETFYEVCPEGTVCADGECTGLPCGHPDCPTGEPTCPDGDAVTYTPTCAGHCYMKETPCNPGHACDDNQCRQFCTLDLDCPGAPFVCQDGFCVYPEPPCSCRYGGLDFCATPEGPVLREKCDQATGACIEELRDECGPGETCVSRTCLPRLCTVDADCGAPTCSLSGDVERSRCDAELGRCVDTTEPCADGSHCWRGECAAACSTDTYCGVPSCSLDGRAVTSAACDAATGRCAEVRSPCAVTERCEHGACIPELCTTDIDCEPATPTCLDDGTAALAVACEAGRCVAEVVACPSGTCEDGACLGPPCSSYADCEVPCDGHDDCAILSGQCASGRCEPTPSCTSAADCPGGGALVCDGEAAAGAFTCSPAGGCVWTGEACGEGEVCNAGLCAACSQDADCDDGIACTVDICHPEFGCLLPFPNDGACFQPGCSSWACDPGLGCLVADESQCGSICSGATCAPTEVVITGPEATYDTFLTKGEILYGDHPWLTAWNGTKTSSVLAQGLLAFDTSAIPAGATARSATLSLYRQTGSGTLSLHPLLRLFDEAKASMSTTGFAPWTVAGALGAGTDHVAVADVTEVIPLGSGAWFDFDVLATVSRWRAGEIPALGWILLTALPGPNEEKRLTFESSDTTEVGKRPKIAVTTSPECCLADADADTVPDETDVCPFVPDPAQSDSDGDGRGDACPIGVP